MNKVPNNKDVSIISEKRLWKIPIKNYPAVGASPSAMMVEPLQDLPARCKQFDR